MKTYEILTIGSKQNIKYYINGVLDSVEFYREGETEIRAGYEDAINPKKTDISKIDIDTLTPQQINKLKQKLGL